MCQWPPSRRESLLREQKWHTDAISQGRIYASKHVSDRNTDATRWHHCVCTTASHSALNPDPPVCLPPPHPISTPQRKLVHHVGFEAPWWGRVCTAALLCLVLHNMSWGIDIPPAFSVSLPPSLFSSGAALPLPAHYFEGLKKAAGGVKIAAPALPCLGAACLPAATPEYQQDPPQPLSQQPGCCCIPISPTEAPTPTKALQARGKINKTKRIWWAADKEHNVFISWYLKDLRFRLTCIAWAVIWEGKQLLKYKDTTSNLY